MSALNRTKEFIDRPVKKLLLVEDDDNQRMSLSELMKSEQVNVTAVGTAESALEVIQARQFDCAIVDLGLPDLPGTELIERIRKTKGGEELPVVIYTGQDLTKVEERRLQNIAATLIVKGEGSSERLGTMLADHGGSVAVTPAAEALTQAQRARAAAGHHRLAGGSADLLEQGGADSVVASCSAKAATSATARSCTRSASRCRTSRARSAERKTRLCAARSS